MLNTYQKSLGLTNDTVKFVSKQLGNLDTFPEAPAKPTLEQEKALKRSEVLGVSKKLLASEKKASEAIVKEVQQLLGLKKVDGRYGIDTKAAVIAYQQANGLEADGIIGKKTMALLRGEPQVIMANAETPAKVEKVKFTIKNPVKGFFKDFFASKVEKTSSSQLPSFSELDNHISAKSNLEKLESSIYAIKQTKSDVEVNNVFTQAIQDLQGKVPAALLNKMASAKTSLEKANVLSYIANALMGGKGSRERIEKQASVKEFIAADKKNAARQDAEWAKLGFNMSVKRQEAYGMISKAGVYQQENYRSTSSTALFSLRTKKLSVDGSYKVLGGLQAFAGSSIETVQLNAQGKDQIPITVSKEQLKTLVDNLTDLQYNNIRINRLGGRKVSNEKIAQMILSGEIQSQAFFAKSANCFNDAVGLRFPKPKVVVGVRAGNGADGTGDKGVSTNGGDNAGGDNSAGGTDGDGSGGSNGGTDAGSSDV